MATPVVINVSINAQGAQAGAQQIATALAQIATASQSTAQKSANAFNAVFSGTFLGGLARQAVHSLLNEFKQLALGTIEVAARTEALHNAVLSEAQANRLASTEVEKQANAIHNLTFTYEDAYKSLTKMIASQLDFTKASQLASVAQDLSVTTGRGLSDEYEALLRSILQLQSRSLRLAGVYLTVDEVLNKLTATTGRNRNSFSTLEKQQALLNAVIEYGARVSGNFDAILGTAAGKMKVFEKSINDAQIALGNAFLPVVAEALNALTALINNIAAHPHIYQTLAAAVGVYTASLVLAKIATIALSESTIFSIPILGTFATSLQIAATSLVDVAAADALATAANTTVAASFIVASGGIAAITIGLGVAVAALYAYSTAVEVAKVADDRRTLTLDTRQKIIRQDIDWVNKHSEALNSSNKSYDSLLGVIQSLDPITKIAIQQDLIAADSTDKRTAAQERLIKALNDRKDVEQVELNLGIKQTILALSSIEATKAATDAKIKQTQAEAAANLAAIEAAAKNNNAYVAIVRQKTALERGGAALLGGIAPPLGIIQSIDNNLRNPKKAVLPEELSGNTLTDYRKALDSIAPATAQFNESIIKITDDAKPFTEQWEKGISTLAELAFKHKEAAIQADLLSGNQEQLAIDTKASAASWITNDESLQKVIQSHNLFNGTLETSLSDLIRERGVVSDSAQAWDTYTKALQSAGEKAVKLTPEATRPFLESQSAQLLNDYQKQVQAFKEHSDDPLLANVTNTDREALGLLQDTINKSTEGWKKYFGAFGTDAQAEYDKWWKNLPPEERTMRSAAAAVKAYAKEIRTPQDAIDDAIKQHQQLQKVIQKLNETRNELTKGGTDTGLKIQQIQLDQYVKSQEEVFKLRSELGKPIGPITGSLDDLKHQVEVLNLEKKTKDDVFKLTLVQAEAQQKADVARIAAVSEVAKAETLYQDQYFTFLRQRREGEQNLSAEIAIEIQKRAEIEQDAIRSTQELQAKAFLDTLTEGRTSREGFVTSLTKFQISQGDFSFADANQLIQKARELTTNPIVEVQKALKTSTDKAKESTDAAGISLNTHGVKIDNNSSKLDSNTQALQDLAQVVHNWGIQPGGTGIPGLTVDAGEGSYSKAYLGPVSKTINKLTPNQIAGVLTQAGWPAPLIPLMTAVAQAESGDKSGSNPRAYNPNGADQSYGLLQVNMRGGLGPARRAKYGLSSNEDLFDPLTNARIALDLYKNGGGLRNWGAFTDNRYKQYLNPNLVPLTSISQAIGEAKLPFNPKGNLGLVNPFGNATSPFGASVRGVGSSQLAEKQTVDEINRIQTETARLEDLKNATYAASQAELDSFKNARFGNVQRKVRLDILNQTLPVQANLRQGTLELDRIEELYNQKLKVSVDNVVALRNAEDDLNRLYTNSIAVREEIQSAQLKIIDAEKMTRKNTIDLVVNEVNSERLISNAIKEEYNTRWKADQDLRNQQGVLNALYSQKYLQSEQFRTRVTTQNAVTRKQSAVQLYTDIRKAEDDLVHYEQDAALRYRLAWLSAVTDVKKAHEDAVSADLKAQAQLSDVFVLDSEKVRASVLGDISKVSSISESYAGLFKDTFKVYGDAIDVWIDKTTAKAGNLGKIFNGFFKDVFHRAEGTLEKSILDTIFPESSDVTKAKKGIDTTVYLEEENARRADVQSIATMVGANDVQIQSLGNLSASTQYTAAVMAQAGQIIAGAMQQLGGGGALSLLSGGDLGSGGGFNIHELGHSGGFGGGSLAPILQQIVNGGSSSGSGSLPSSSGPSGLSLLGLIPGGIATLPRLSGGNGTGSAATLSQGNILQRILGLGGKGGLGSLFGSDGLKSLGFSLASQAPLLGLGLGGALGGDSKLGSILGSVGGLLGGGIIGALTGTGIFATGGVAAAGGSLSFLPALLTNPITLIAAPLIIAGAVILAKNAARRKAETQRAAIIGDAITQLTTILSQVKSDKMDGSQAITQATQIRADYITQVSALKDSKTRGIALKDVSRLDTLITQIQAAAAAQQRRKETDLAIVPTYAGGGITTQDIIRVSQGETLVYPDMSSKTLPGRFDGRDNILTRAPIGTTIISPQMFGGFASGGVNGVSAHPILRPVMNVTVINVMSEEEATRLGNKIPDAVYGIKASSDAKKNPMRLPAAIGDALGVDY